MTDLKTTQDRGANPALAQFLLSRRSHRPREMFGPGPDADQLTRILTVGARVPDHGKLAPWRFITFQGEARGAFGLELERVWLKNNPDTKPEGLRMERERFERAPLVIAVISTARHHKIPIWEQQLSAGAVCHNLCLAAQAEGFGAVWLSEWPAFDPDVAGLLDMDEADQVAGFIYVGHAPLQEDRPRPDLSAVVSAWRAPS